MVNFELTERIRNGYGHVLESEIELSPETKVKFEKNSTLRSIKVVSLDDLLELSTALRRIPEHVDPLKSCKFVHELVVGARVLPRDRFSPDKYGKRIDTPVMERLKQLEHLQEERKYQAMVENITSGFDKDEESDAKVYSEHMSIGGHFIITIVVLYFAGYFVVMKTKGETMMAVLTGLACAIIGMLVETWLFMIRSEKTDRANEKKQSRRTPFGLRSRTTPSTPISPYREPRTQ